MSKKRLKDLSQSIKQTNYFYFIHILCFGQTFFSNEYTIIHKEYTIIVMVNVDNIHLYNMLMFYGDKQPHKTKYFHFE